MSDTQPSPLQVAARRTPARTWVILGLILALALAVRVHSLGARSLWHDEFLSLFSSAGNTGPAHAHEGFLPKNWNPMGLHVGSWVSVWTTQVRDLHPPVYFLFLRAWRMAFGDGHIALRSLALLCSMLSIVAMFWVVREMFDDAATLWTCAILAVAMQHVVYAREVRQYSMQILWAVLAVYTLLRIERRGASWPRLAALAALLWLLAETHYFFPGVAGAMGLYTLIYFPKKDRWWAIGAMAVAGAVFIVTAGPFILQQIHDAPVRAGGLIVHEHHHAWHTLVRMAGTPFNLLGYPPKSLEKFLPATGLALLVPIVFFRKNRKLVLLWLWAVLPICVVAASDLRSGMEQLVMPRYALLSLPALAALAAATLRDQKILRHLAPAAVFAVCLWTLPELYKPYNFNNYANRHRQMAIMLKKDVKPGDAVLFIDDPRWAEANQLKAQVYEYYVPNHPDPIGLVYGDKISADFAKQLDHYPRVWLVSGFHTDTSHYLPGSTTQSPQVIGRFCLIREVTPAGK